MRCPVHQRGQVHTACAERFCSFRGGCVSADLGLSAKVGRDRIEGPACWQGGAGRVEEGAVPDARGRSAHGLDVNGHGDNCGTRPALPRRTDRMTSKARPPWLAQDAWRILATQADPPNLTNDQVQLFYLGGGAAVEDQNCLSNLEALSAPWD